MGVHLAGSVNNLKSITMFCSMWSFLQEASHWLCNILVTNLLYSSSYNKTSLTFEVEAIILRHRNPAFCQFFDPMQLLGLVIRDDLLHISFHPLLIVERAQFGQDAESSISLIPRSSWSLFRKLAHLQILQNFWLALLNNKMTDIIERIEYTETCCCIPRHLR